MEGGGRSHFGFLNVKREIVALVCFWKFSLRVPRIRERAAEKGGGGRGGAFTVR